MIILSPHFKEALNYIKKKISVRSLPKQKDCLGDFCLFSLFFLLICAQSEGGGGAQRIGWEVQISGELGVEPLRWNEPIRLVQTSDQEERGPRCCDIAIAWHKHKLRQLDFKWFMFNNNKGAKAEAANGCPERLESRQAGRWASRPRQVDVS